MGWPAPPRGTRAANAARDRARQRGHDLRARHSLWSAGAGQGARLHAAGRRGPGSRDRGDNRHLLARGRGPAAPAALPRTRPADVPGRGGAGLPVQSRRAPQFRRLVGAEPHVRVHGGGGRRQRHAVDAVRRAREAARPVGDVGVLRRARRRAGDRAHLPGGRRRTRDARRRGQRGVLEAPLRRRTGSRRAGTCPQRRPVHGRRRRPGGVPNLQHDRRLDHLPAGPDARAPADALPARPRPPARKRVCDRSARRHGWRGRQHRAHFASHQQGLGRDDSTVARRADGRRPPADQPRARRRGRARAGDGRRQRGQPAGVAWRVSDARAGRPRGARRHAPRPGQSAPRRKPAAWRAGRRRRTGARLAGVDARAVRPASGHVAGRHHARARREGDGICSRSLAPGQRPLRGDPRLARDGRAADGSARHRLTRRHASRRRHPVGPRRHRDRARRDPRWPVRASCFARCRRCRTWMPATATATS